MLKLVQSFASDESGATAIEYALIASGIFLGIVSVLGQVGSALSTAFSSVNSGFQ